jgi:small subunit ribosomal protein S18
MSDWNPVRRRRARRRRSLIADVKDFDFDYRAVDILRRFLSETGKILPRRRTGLTARQQRKLTRAIKRARVIALVPFTLREPRTS